MTTKQADTTTDLEPQVDDQDIDLDSIATEGSALDSAEADAALDTVEADDSLEVAFSADEAVVDGEDFYADTAQHVIAPARAGRWKVRLGVAALVIAAAVAGAGVSAAVLSEESRALLKDYGKLQGAYDVLTEDYHSLANDVEGLQDKLAELAELAAAVKGEAKKEG